MILSIKKGFKALSKRIIIGTLLCVSYFNTQAQTFTFDFETNTQGWLADWADYPANDSVYYQLESKYTSLPTYIVPNQKGIFIKGFNHSDDLFMFLKKKLTGLLPNQKYKIQFQLQIASNAPTNAIGVGGGADIVIKAGAAPIEPIKVKAPQAGTTFYLMNIDKGNQSISGTQMDTIGRTGVNDTTTQFALINRQNKNPFYATTNANGELWAIVGTESAFEGLSELYYSHIVLTLSVVTGTDDVLREKITIYPNPASSAIFIEGAKIFQYCDINDITGRLVQSTPLSKNEIDISFLPEGHYILRLKQVGGAISYAKFVKTKG